MRLHRVSIVGFDFNGFQVVILMSMTKNGLEGSKTSKIYWTKIHLKLSKNFRTT